jgi:hypothetical protein
MGSGTDESSDRWMVGRRLVFACVASGRRGLVVEVDRYAIARRKLGYSMGVQTRSTVHLNSGRASLPALRRAPPERCGGRPLVQVTHDAGTSALLITTNHYKASYIWDEVSTAGIFQKTLL